MQTQTQTKTLVDTAVINSNTTGLKAWSDKLFTHWFNRLVYAQIWEDPQSDLDALQLSPGASILTISSGGCNALAYLSAQPAAVHAVDLNAAHLAMLEMKKQALACLPSYRAVLDYLGHANLPGNTDLYERYLRTHLNSTARNYWEQTDWLGRPRYRMFAHHAYRHGLLGRFIGFSHFFAKCMGGNLSKLCEARSMEEQRTLFARHVAPVFDSGLFRFIARQPVALYSLGIPPAQFEALQRDATDGLHTLFKERMRHLACDFPLQENCFAQQAFRRAYDTANPSSLPLYLQERHYPTLRAHLDKLHAHHCTLTQFMQSQADGSLDAYLLLDAQDWMDAAQLAELWQEITRTAKPGARVVFRTGGESSPLEQQLPVHLLRHWHTDVAHNRQLYQTDRSAIYGGMHLYVKTA